MMEGTPGETDPENLLLQSLSAFLQDISSEVFGGSPTITRVGVLANNNNNMCHQTSHIDHPHIDDNNGKKRDAYIGHMPLNPEGLVLRLDLRKEINFVYVPFGSMFLIPARLYHGGHYGSEGVFRFHCVLANFNWDQQADGEEVERLLWSKSMASYEFSTPIDDIAKFKLRETKCAFTGRRVPYYRKLFCLSTSGIAAIYQLGNYARYTSLRTILQKKTKDVTPTDEIEYVSHPDLPPCCFQSHHFYMNTKGNSESSNLPLELYTNGKYKFVKDSEMCDLTGTKVGLDLVTALSKNDDTQKNQIFIDGWVDLIQRKRVCGTYVINNANQGRTDIGYIGGQFGPSIYDWTTVVGLFGEFVIYIAVEEVNANISCDMNEIEGRKSMLGDADEQVCFFINKFKEEAKAKMGEDIFFHAFTMNGGRTLTFAANRCYHAIYVRDSSNGPGRQSVEYLLMHELASL